MTAPAVTIPDYVAIKQPHTLRGLAGIIADLLAEAEDLGSPVRAELWRDEIEHAFGRDPETFRVLAQWAERFGGTLTGEPLHLGEWPEAVEQARSIVTLRSVMCPVCALARSPEG